MLRFLTYMTAMFLGAIGLVQCSYADKTDILNIPADAIMEGDIVFRRGNGITSNIVAFNDADGKYSHVGVVAKGDSGLVIVHAVPGEGSDGLDRVRSVPLTDFFSKEKAVKGEIMRYPLDSLQRREISARAIEKARQKVKFDHQYDLSDTSQLYCSEFVQLIFGKVGVDLAQGRHTWINAPGMSGDYIMPSDIHQNPLLESTYLY